MKIISTIGLSGLIVLISGCTNIPQAAIDVNKQVAVGIKAISDNGLEMSTAWEFSAYNMLDERWTHVYSKANSTYRSKNGISATTALTAQQQEDIAGLSALIRDEVRARIHTQAEAMKAIINANTKTTLAANESITNLLISANGITNFQQAAIKEVGSLLPIPPAITTFINDALQTSGL